MKDVIDFEKRERNIADKTNKKNLNKKRLVVIIVIIVLAVVIGITMLLYYSSRDVRNFLDQYLFRKNITQEKLETIDLDHIEMKGYGFQIEMKYTTFRLGFRIVEVPIIFANRKEGTSKMSSGIFGEAFWGVMKMKMRKIKPVKK